MLKCPHNSTRNRISDYMLRAGAFMAKLAIGVTDIFAEGDYLQILGSIVGLDSISMIYRHAFRDRPNKGCGYKRMESLPKLATLQAKDKLKIACFGVQAWLQKARLSINAARIVVAQVVGPHAALVANFVSRKAFYCLPNFVRIVFRHLDSFQSRCLEPFAALERCNGSLISYQLDSKVAIWGT